MQVEHTDLPGVLLITPKVYGDHRGFFLETYSHERYREAGIPLPFVQDNLSASTKGVLRGLHYQQPHAQGKLVQVIDGAVFDVAVDLRPNSATLGRWVGVTLTGDSHQQLYIPPGCAHGFLVLSERAVFHYKCTDYYSPESERGIIWNDPDLAIAWPLDGEPLLSERDRRLPRLADVEGWTAP